MVISDALQFNNTIHLFKQKTVKCLYCSTHCDLHSLYQNFRIIEGGGSKYQRQQWKDLKLEILPLIQMLAL